MTTFFTSIFSCPFCKEIMYIYELGSYTVHHSTVYSDGKVECSPPVLKDPHILICPTCRKGFWKDDARLPEEEGMKYDNELPEAMNVHDLSIAHTGDFHLRIAEYYSNFIENGPVLTKDKEIFVRIEIWHLLNDTKRRDSPFGIKNVFHETLKRISFLKKKKDLAAVSSSKENNLFTKNLKKLIKIFIPENNEEKLLLVEMHRELGQFKRASMLLKSMEGLEHPPHYKKIGWAVRWRMSNVLCLS